MKFAHDLPVGVCSVGDLSLNTDQGGHCRKFAMEKTAEGVVSLVICNNGPSLPFGRCYRGRTGELTNRPAAKLMMATAADGCVLDSETGRDDALWFLLKRDVGAGGAGKCAYNGDFCEYAIPHLIGKSWKRILAESKAIHGYARAGPEGNSGTCGINSPKTSYKYVLQRHAKLTYADIKEVRFTARMMFVLTCLCPSST